MLFPATGRPISARLHRVTNADVHVRPDDPSQLDRLSRGAEVRYLDSYWGERAELVLDDRRSWARTEFLPSDTVSYPVGGLERDAEIVKDGWDHEHCRICWSEIAPGAAPIGFLSDAGDWICEDCHAKYVTTRSLDFVPDE